jgi:hypothetical protein
MSGDDRLVKDVVVVEGRRKRRWRKLTVGERILYAPDREPHVRIVSRV